LFQNQQLVMFKLSYRNLYTEDQVLNHISRYLVTL